MTEKRKQLIFRIIMRFIYINGRCKKCACKLDNGYDAEKKGSRWIYWCHGCYNGRFISQILSSPMALAKYYNIYGKHPKDVVLHN